MHATKNKQRKKNEEKQKKQKEQSSLCPPTKSVKDRPTDRQTNRPIEGWVDTPSYRVKYSQIKRSRKWKKEKERKKK